MFYQITNIITSLRLLLAIPIYIFIYQGNEAIALSLFAVAGLSDWLDGFLARKYSWSSSFGEIVDPLADKVLILSTLLALAFSGLLPFWLVSLLLARDAIIVMGAIAYLMLFEGNNSLPNRWGKHYNGWTIALFIIVLLQGLLYEHILLSFINILYPIAVLGVLFFLIMSLLNYFKDQGSKIYAKLFTND